MMRPATVNKYSSRMASRTPTVPRAASRLKTSAASCPISPTSPQNLPQCRSDQAADAGPAHSALCDGRHPDRHRRAGAYRCAEHRARPVSMRPASGACVSVHRRQPAGHQLAGGHPGVWPRAGAEAAAYAASARIGPRCPPTRKVRAHAELEGIRHNTGTESVADIRREMRAMMMDNVGVFRTAELLDGSAVVRLRTLKDRFSRSAIMDKGQRWNTELFDLGTGLSARPGRSDGGSGASSPGARPRASERTSRSVTIRAGSSIRWPGWTRRFGSPGLQAGDAGTVRAGETHVLKGAR